MIPSDFTSEDNSNLNCVDGGNDDIGSGSFGVLFIIWIEQSACGLPYRTRESLFHNSTKVIKEPFSESIFPAESICNDKPSFIQNPSFDELFLINASISSFFIFADEDLFIFIF